VLWKWNKAVEKGLEPSGIPLLLNLPAAERAAHDIYTIGSCICYTSDKDHITFNRISRSQMTTKIRKQRIKRAQEEWLNK
jgi:hypothetical protein